MACLGITVRDVAHPVRNVPLPIPTPPWLGHGKASVYALSRAGEKSDLGANSLRRAADQRSETKQTVGSGWLFARDCRRGYKQLTK
jgi:hypothetical protein